MAEVTFKEVASYKVTAQEIINLLVEKYGFEGGKIGKVTIFGNGPAPQKVNMLLMPLHPDMNFCFDIEKGINTGNIPEVRTVSKPTIVTKPAPAPAPAPATTPYFTPKPGWSVDSIPTSVAPVAPTNTGWNTVDTKEPEKAVDDLPIIAGCDDDDPVVDDLPIIDDGVVEVDGDLPIIDDEYVVDTDYADRLGDLNSTEDELPIVDSDYEEIEE